VTPSFTHLSITFSNQRFSNCSPTVDVGFVKLTSDSFCGNRVFKMNIQFCCHLCCSKRKVKMSLCLTNYALRHEGVWGSGCIDPHFLNLGTSWRSVVSFTPLPLCPCGKCPRYPLDRRLGGPQSRSGRRGEDKILEPSGAQTPTPLSSSPLPVAVPTTLSRLLNFEGHNIMNSLPKMPTGR
jgi:hypothetical protein